MGLQKLFCSFLFLKNGGSWDLGKLLNKSWECISAFPVPTILHRCGELGGQMSRGLVSMSATVALVLLPVVDRHRTTSACHLQDNELGLVTYLVWGDCHSDGGIQGICRYNGT
ncbi:hypothetical protein BDV29DRAFT_23369 [Aspergillus leporis]|jgi:hypothetical protein|uniref:Uncharacterized protein n=1 Tax=Aspergillus leporis TaxID=41062 RepID=A0A5N5WTM6_9EURO|nr:hypothetical protein BDV29DRAFT_23369 [Aspergillus leporis]